MEINQLKHFLAVMDEGAISKAAIQLNIAQPALSQSIARMEKNLGVTLFARSRRGSAPTPAALAMVDDVRSGMARLDAAQHSARQTDVGLAGVLKIGLVSSALFDVLPALLNKIRTAAPNVQLVLHEMSNEEQAEALEHGVIDVGLMHAPVSIKGHMTEKVLREDKLVAAVPASIAQGLDHKISLQQIAEVGLVLYPKDQLPSLYIGITQAIRQAGYTVRINQHANRTLTVLACVAGGCGIGLLPSWIRSIGFPGVTFCDVVDPNHLPSFDLIAVWETQTKTLLNQLFTGL